MPGNRYLFYGMVRSVDVFTDYDCSKCRNCFKMYIGCILAKDISKNVQFIGITPEQIVDAYLEKEKYGMNYQTKHEPCDFLQEDGNCKLGDCKPDSCKNIRIRISRRDYQVY